MHWQPALHLIMWGCDPHSPYLRELCPRVPRTLSFSAALRTRQQMWVRLAGALLSQRTDGAMHSFMLTIVLPGDVTRCVGDKTELRRGRCIPAEIWERCCRTKSLISGLRGDKTPS